MNRAAAELSADFVYGGIRFLLLLSLISSEKTQLHGLLFCNISQRYADQAKRCPAVPELVEQRNCRSGDLGGNIARLRKLFLMRPVGPVGKRARTDLYANALRAEPVPAHP